MSMNVRSGFFPSKQLSFCLKRRQGNLSVLVLKCTPHPNSCSEDFRKTLIQKESYQNRLGLTKIGLYRVYLRKIQE